MTYEGLMEGIEDKVNDANLKADPYIRFKITIDTDIYDKDINGTEIGETDEIFGLKVNGKVYDSNVDLVTVYEHMDVMAYAAEIINDRIQLGIICANLNL